MARAGIRGEGLKVLHKALKQREPFKTSGSFYGQTYTRGSVGELNVAEREQFFEDVDKGVTYVVYSYETPIAWVRKDGSVYKVQQKFSVTTSRHQGFLYLLDRDADL